MHVIPAYVKVCWRRASGRDGRLIVRNRAVPPPSSSATREEIGRQHDVRSGVSYAGTHPERVDDIA
jgi:hypothetical protein